MDKKIPKKPFYQKHWKALSAGSVLAVLLGYWLVFGEVTKSYTLKKAHSRLVVVKKGEFQDFIPVRGTIEPRKTVFLDVVEGGRVSEILVEEGTIVKKGQSLVRLTNEQLLLEISNNEASVARTLNDLRSSKLNMEFNQLNQRQNLLSLHFKLREEERKLKRSLVLIKDGFISEEEHLKQQEVYQQTKNEFELKQAHFRRDSVFKLTQLADMQKSAQNMRENLAFVRKRLDNLVIKAPVDGELASLELEEGQVINYGTRIGKVNNLDNYKLRLGIDEHYIPKVSKGLRTEVYYADSTYEGRLRKIYSEVKDGKFYADMDFIGKSPAKVQVGQTARVRLELGEPMQSVLLPKGSFFNATGGRWVFVLDPATGKAHKREIRLGRENSMYYEVIEGLSPDDQVLVSSYEGFEKVEEVRFE
ncbi:MAG: HlyD family efflux transporter periplasmic adaptor subunit [Cytophagales bacterium]|nr:HlyD family efflux transporter periplasmic adaptor subunit [Cytophagales bacterium]